MKRTLLIITLPFLILSQSCGLLGKATHGELTRRYHTMTASTIDDIEKYVAVEGYSFAPEIILPPKPKTFHDLSVAVQEELIKAYSVKDKTSSDLIKSVSSSFTPIIINSQENNIDDRTAFKKRLVFSIRNRSYSPADRIWKIYISLEKTDGNIRFSSSSTLATDFEAIDIGKLSFNRKSSFSSSLNAGSGITATNTDKNTSTSSGKTEGTDAKTGETTSSNNSDNREAGGSRSVENKIGGSVGFNSEFSSNEEVALKQRFVKLSGSVKKNALSLYQESTSGIDLSGNIVADVEFNYDNSANPNNLIDQTVFEFNNVKTGIVYNKPADITAKSSVVVYPSMASDIYGTIRFEAIIRKVNANGNTIAESDDDVSFIGGELSAAKRTETVLLLSRREVTPHFWHILNSSGNPIRIKSPTMVNPIDLLFKSFDDAKNFLEWLKQNRTEVIAANNTIAGSLVLSPGAGIGVLDANTINNLSVHIIVN